MLLILILVFILSLLVINVLMSSLFKNSASVISTRNIYDQIKGTGSSNFGKFIFSKKHIKVSLLYKKVFPVWLLIFVIFLLLLKNFIIALFVSIIFSGIYFLYQKNKDNLKKKEIFIYQFREALVSISNSLKSGSTLQNALERCKNEMDNTLRGKKDKPILRELEIMVNEINLGNHIVKVLEGFKSRMPFEEVENFVNAAVITEKTGGNLTEVMNNVCTIIGDRIQIKREIDSLTAGKRNESRVLTVAPLIMIPLLALFSPSYLKPMYDTLAGKILMVIGILLLVFNFIISKKIMNIEL